MKRILFGLISVCMVLLSCKKEHTKIINPDQTLYKVTINVGFSQQTSDFKPNSLKKTNSLSTNNLQTFALSDQIKVIYYAVYDSVGNNVHIIKQLSTDADFGSFTDNLKSGRYTIAVAAGQSNNLVLGPQSNQTLSKLSTDIISDNHPDGTNSFSADVFFKKIALSVSTTASTQSIDLVRIVSQLVVNIEDAIPANAQTMEVIIGNVDNLFNIGTETLGYFNMPSQVTNFYTIPSAAIGTTNYKISTIVLGQSASVTIQCASTPIDVFKNDFGYLGYNKDIFAQKVINNVAFQPNTETLLTGKLFGGNGTTGTGGVKAVIDTTWNQSPLLISFP